MNGTQSSHRAYRQIVQPPQIILGFFVAPEMQSPFSKIDKLQNAIKLQQPLSKMFDKATSLLGLSNTPKAPALDGEIVYSKNNVCVHQAGSDDPAPGYLSLRCSNSENVSTDRKSVV